MPGYIGDTKAKRTTGSHHVMPIGQGDVDSCSNLHGENKTAREPELWTFRPNQADTFDR